jgi:hypothetical protein
MRLLACCLLLSLSGCSREERPKAEPAPVTAAPAPAPGLPVEQEPTPEELPVPEDFEPEAAQQVTAENYRAELDALERELEAEGK